MLEKDIEEQVCKWVEDRGGQCLKLKIEGERGFPDRMILLPAIVSRGESYEVSMFVELKRPGGEVSPHQAKWIEKLTTLGQAARVCYSLDDVKDECRKLKRRIHNRIFNRNNPDAQKKYDTRQREKGRTAVGFATTALYSARRRAKEKNLLCLITVDDILSVVPQDGKCPALGEELTYGSPLNRNSASLDRIAPGVGYVPGNITVISFLANTIKQNATAGELQRVADWVKHATRGA